MPSTRNGPVVAIAKLWTTDKGKTVLGTLNKSPHSPLIPVALHVPRNMDEGTPGKVVYEEQLLLESDEGTFGCCVPPEIATFPNIETTGTFMLERYTCTIVSPGHAALVMDPMLNETGSCD